MANRNSQKFEDLTALDWDDSALRLAYDRGMKLRNCKSKKEKGRKYSHKKESGRQWKVGDYCRAVYYGDEMEYEARIVKISDDNCTIVFLGYDEEVQVELADLIESLGKPSRKAQIKKATVFLCADDSADMADLTSDGQQTPRSRKRTSASGVQEAIPDQSMYNYTAAETTFHGHHLAPNCSVSANPSFLPPAPPMPQCMNVAQNTSLSAVLTSWYMAGYFTGLHQGQKGPQYQPRHCHCNQYGCHL